MNRTITYIVLGVFIGVLAVRTYDLGRTIARKWNAIAWVMTGYNEEIVSQHMKTQKAEMQIVVTKK